MQMKEHHSLHEIIHNYIHDITSTCTLIVACIGSLVLLGGIIISTLNIIIVIYNSIFYKRIPFLVGLSYNSVVRQQVATFGRVRKQLGEITALGLEILVVADIMESLCKSVEDFSWNTLGKMAAIAIFRAALAFALGREIHEINEKIHEEKVEQDKELAEELEKKQPKKQGSKKSD